jgi:hypothetical protein
MFDTVVVDQRPRVERVTTSVNVTEHRAPTDESVKLLREMEAAVEARRIESFQLVSNDFTCRVDAFRDIGYEKLTMIAVFDLNGKRYTAEASVHKYDYKTSDDCRGALITKVKDAILEELSRQILFKAEGQASLTRALYA